MDSAASENAALCTYRVDFFSSKLVWEETLTTLSLDRAVRELQACRDEGYESRIECMLVKNLMAS
jgi:hypothetical protein